MTVETTIQEMFDKYPMLFGTRKDCFNHLFCTIGNGYKWKWGQLVRDGRGDPLYDEASEKERNEKDYEADRPRASQSEENAEKKRERDEAFVEAGMEKPGEYDWYPLSRTYSKLFTVPGDARDDWKEAVEECKAMLDEDGVDWRGAK